MTPSALAQDLADLLGQVRRPGDFYATGTIDIHPPRLEVEGVGAIALPLLPAQAEQLIVIAERAPYGRGTETLLDTNVRRTWQVGAERVRISGKAWDQDLATMVAQAAAGLGVTGSVQAELYKLLIYDTGSFFVSHRDSEKATGMFATLVVMLPSDYSGGELLVRHKGREVRLDLRQDEPSEAAFAAFYADCVHEVLPVVSGYRLALIYNLVRTGRGPLPRPPDYAREQQRVTALLQAWTVALESTAGSEAMPAKLIYPLEHAYTQAELDFATLKGADAASAAVMIEAAQAANCDLYLALVSVAESGLAECAGGDYWDESDGEFEVVEVDETTRTVAEWRHPDGGRPSLGPLPFEDDELSPPDAFEGLEPDELDFQEATGNAGATFDRLYQRAALVLWPRAHRIAVLAQGGLEASVPFLGELARRWRDSGAGQEVALWQEAHRLAAQIQRDWPDSAWARLRASEAGNAAALLTHLMVLDDMEAIDAFLAERSAAGAYGEHDNEALAAALGRLSPVRAGELLTAIVTHNAPTLPVACTGLLARCVAEGLERTRLGPAALALLQSLPSGSQPASSDWPRPEAPTAAMVEDLLMALEAVDPAFASSALAHLLAHRTRYRVDEVLVPAAMHLHEGEGTRRLASVQALRAVILAHLRRRIAEVLEPPADWQRPSVITCTCDDCRELSRFLDDPTRPTWAFKAAQARRLHVEQSIKRDGCDLDWVTERKGSPHSLLCTKNQASYERRVRQRAQDLAHMMRLMDDSAGGVSPRREG